MNTINEAMRRVKLPAGNNEQFKAGVRALAHAYDEARKEQATTPTANKLPPAEWRPATPWQDRLYDLVQLAFGNEESFIADLLPNAPACTLQPTPRLLGKRVVIAGSFSVPRREAKKRLEALGAKVVGAVSTKTDLLFYGKNSGSKLTKAKDLGIPRYGRATLCAIMSAF